MADIKIPIELSMPQIFLTQFGLKTFIEQELVNFDNQEQNPSLLIDELKICQQATFAISNAVNSFDNEEEVLNNPFYKKINDLVDLSLALCLGILDDLTENIIDNLELPTILELLDIILPFEIIEEVAPAIFKQDRSDLDLSPQNEQILWKFVKDTVSKSDLTFTCKVKLIQAFKKPFFRHLLCLSLNATRMHLEEEFGE